MPEVLDNSMKYTIYLHAKQIDNKRGDIPRSTYIRRAIENYLKSNGNVEIIQELVTEANETYLN
jgi:metal-responsive CopG/Arc/MetJ family transcriptional regulator